MEEMIVERVLMIIGFLSLAVAASLLLKKIKFPYTIGLVVIGVVLGMVSMGSHYLPELKDVMLTPEMILYIILPTLIYDAAINIDAQVLKKNIIPILLLAVLGLLISACFIGGLLSLVTTLSLGTALLFGALISATDPVSVIALFNEIGAPRRLITLIDGESLFNDATAIVFFTIILSVLTSGQVVDGALVWSSVGNFFIVLVGGLLTGTVIGLLGALLVRRQKDNLILQVTVSLIMAYVSFIAADYFFHVSGVMSTLAAGITIKFYTDEVIKQKNHHYMESFWEYFSFVANSFVFLLLGLTESHSFRSMDTLKGVVVPMFWVVLIVTLARALGIYLLIPLFNKMKPRESISSAFQHILFWGGVRGAVPIALVLAIPADFVGRELIVHITFGYILFTLFVQGTTIKKLMAKLGIRPDRSFFDCHEGVVSTFEFPSERLAELIIAQLLPAFDEEGFVISDHGSEEDTAYFLKKGQKGVLLEVFDTELRITTEPNDVSYGKQMLSETLIELNESVTSLKDVVHPENMQEIVKDRGVVEAVAFNLGKYLNTDLMTTELKSTNKNDLIRELIEIAMAKGLISDEEGVINAVLERENSMTTGIGGGIAVPHAKFDGVEHITLVVGVKREGIDFDSIDNSPAKLFFLILSPKMEVNPHMQLLASIAKRVSCPEVYQRVLEADSVLEVKQLLQKGV